MKKSEITIGGFYMARLGKKLCRVRVIEPAKPTGWRLYNLDTSAEIIILTSAKIKYPLLMTDQINAYHEPMSLDDYHKRPEISHSQFELFIDSPPLYHGTFITKEYQRRQSDVFDDGQIVHNVILGGNLDDILTIIPESVLNKDGHRKGPNWIEWSDAHAGKINRTEKECDALFRMIASVKAHKRASWLLEGEGYFEHNIFWTDPETGLKLRARLDRISFMNGDIVVSDLKTTRAMTPYEFFSDCASYGYHRQAAWYEDGIKSLFEKPVHNFCFITVDKTPAHETHVYELEPADIEYGRKENRQYLQELKWRIENNKWEARDNGDIILGGLPTWAYQESQWRIA